MPAQCATSASGSSVNGCMADRRVSDVLMKGLNVRTCLPAGSGYNNEPTQPTPQNGGYNQPPPTPGGYDEPVINPDTQTQQSCSFI